MLSPSPRPPPYSCASIYIQKPHTHTPFFRQSTRFYWKAWANKVFRWDWNWDNVGTFLRETGTEFHLEGSKTLCFHPPSPFPWNSCKCNSGSICTALQFWVQLSMLHTAWNNAYTEIGPEVAAPTFCDFLCERLQREVTHKLCWTAQYKFWFIMAQETQFFGVVLVTYFER